MLVYAVTNFREVVRHVSIKIEIPQRGTVELQHAVFDINGTLAVDGVVLPGVTDRLKKLAESLTIHLLTAGTHGNLNEIEQSLGFHLRLVHGGEEKLRYVQQLGPSSVVAFGNGVNDSGMLRLAALGIAVITSEGLAIRAVQTSDVVVRSPVDGIDLLLKPNRLIATLRE
jgi:soluble P-type ATPase